MNHILSVFLPLLFLGLIFPLQAQELGKASYYSNEFDGGRTYFGEIYDKDKFTAAHKVHPQGTRLKVTRVDNGQSVVVRVNDRGPYISGRIIELSYAAARSIGMTNKGVVDVRVEVVSKGTGTGPEVKQPASNSSVSTKTNAQKLSNSSNTNSKGETKKPLNSNNSQPKKSTALNNSKSAPLTRTDNLSGSKTLRGHKPYGLFDIKINTLSKAGFGVQVASFSSYENTLVKVAELQGMWFEDIVVSVEKAGGNKLYKVILGPFANRDQASSYLTSLRKNKKGVDGFVVDITTFSYE